MGLADGINGFLNVVGGAFNSFMIGLVVWGIIFIVCGWFGYRWWAKKQIFKYTVIIVGSNNQIQTTKARIGTNKLGIPKLIIKGYEDPKYYLPVREPNVIFNGNNVRMVAFDGFGYLTYTDSFEIKEEILTEEEVNDKKNKLLDYAEKLGIIINSTFFEKINIDKKKYLETALTPVERSEVVDSVIESTEKGSVMTNVHKWILTFAIITIVMCSVSIIMVAKYNVESAEVSSKAANVLERGAIVLQNTTAENVNSINSNTKMLVNFAASLGKNITLEFNTN